MFKLDELSQEDKELIVYHHYLKNLPEDQLTTLTFNMDSDSAGIINQAADKLKVDRDAIIGYSLIKYLKEHPCESGSTSSSSNKTTSKPKKKSKKS